MGGTARYPAAFLRTAVLRIYERTPFIDDPRKLRLEKLGAFDVFGESDRAVHWTGVARNLAQHIGLRQRAIASDDLRRVI